ncbi:hypothetical protein [Polyangium sorediatum]|uniref:Secreted protein n=1 Tax=Polyangium sorediatum TaxID=889274 RepID=A0ABT6P5I0_9BACT|nr:hypothetical protein [Polyangium sorediatum]MDI1435813.1 hypothetical protein [Polyangium sorediatum]
MSPMRLLTWGSGLALVCLACSSNDASEPPAPSPGGNGGSGPTSSSSSSGGGFLDAGVDAGNPALLDCGISTTVANPWIQTEFDGVPDFTGDFTKRTAVELPRRIHDASVTQGKYGFDLKDEVEPIDPRVALVNVNIHDLTSPDAYGASFQTAGAPGAKIYLSNVYLEPNWPAWVSYDTTNYDGMVLDNSEEIFAEDLTVKNWNADTAADVKSKHAQFVCLRTEGNGHRTLRFWNVGPHYLVKSSINNGTGALVWMKTCTGARIHIYDSTFNGAPQLPADKISCEDGGEPEIVYLTTDPRTTGEMHPMFSSR